MVKPEWWRENEDWYQLNVDLLKRGVNVIRVFATDADLPNEEELKVMRRQAIDGVQVNFIPRSKWPPGVGDMLISGCMVQNWIDPDNSEKAVERGIIAGVETLDHSMNIWTHLSVIGSPRVQEAANTFTTLLQMSHRFEDPDWHRYFFDDNYISIMEPKNRSAAQEAKFIADAMGLTVEHQSDVLDCGAGYGRIAFELQRRVHCNIRALEPSLEMRRKGEPQTPGVAGCNFDWEDSIRMEEMDFERDFDAIISIFTSFGYFLDDATNLDVLCRFNRALKPEGELVLDIDNWQYVASNAGTETSLFKTIEGRRVEIKRIDQVEDRAPRKRRLTQFVVVEDGSIRSLPLVTVQLYTRNEIAQDLDTAGFEISEEFGDYDVNVAFNPLESERYIVLAKKKKAPESRSQPAPVPST